MSIGVMNLSPEDLSLAAAILREEQQFTGTTNRDPEQLERIADALAAGATGLLGSWGTA